MNRILLVLVALPLASFAAGAVTSEPKNVPGYLSLPPTLHPANSQSTNYEDYGEAEFDTHAGDKPLLLKGHHWHVNLVLDNPSRTDDTAVLWAAIKPALLKGGWTVADEYTTSGVVRYQKNGVEARAEFSFPSADQIQMDIVEIAPPSVVLTFAPPAATPEKLSTERGDFPYLAALPGSGGGAGVQDNMPMTVRLPGSDEDELVGSGSIRKSYNSPPGLSTLAFATAYSDAFARAGWTVVSVGQGPHQADAGVLAHYTRNGRDIWASVHDESSDYVIQVADAGADADLARQLARDCHVALYGVLFDFNKSTLKPESDSVLQQVLPLLQKDPALKLEVQGHTDNVGDDAYNQTLSEARAKSVMAWLTAHDAASARLSFKGFGKTMPVATNDNDEGRAKNRRVEVANLSCKGH
jgi:outer membrane protein OmpA-like peptidoglycan-associated protein